MKKCPVCSTYYDDAIMECSRCYCDLVTDNSYTTPPQNPNPNPTHNTNPNYNPNPNPNYNPNYNAAPNYNPNYNTGYNPNFNQNAGFNNYQAPQKYCQRCGNLCDANAAICVKCGSQFNTQSTYAYDDVPSTGLKICCFFIPIVALVLYFTNKDTKPRCAKEYGKWGIIGFVVNYVIATVFSFLISFFSSFLYYY